MISPIAALFAWPVISAALVQALRWPLAIAVVIIGGYLILPERFEIDFPLLPAFDKHTIPALSIVALSLLIAGTLGKGDMLPGWLPKSWIARLLLALVVFGSFATALTNPDRIVSQLSTQPGLRPYDGFSMTLTAAMIMLPMVIGRKFFYGQDAHRLLMVVICIAACGYAFLALYEIRMSPQLNRTFYGFFPHSWAQHVRGGGFRPLVFLQHGLQLALFFCIAILAGAGLFRLGGKYRLGLLAVVWLGLTLGLSKSLGAQMIVVMLLPVVLLLGVRLQLMIAAIISIMVLTYPMLRSAHMVPIDRVMNFAASIDAQRAGSFRTRLENEDRMLERAQQRPAFGWGGWGRSRVRNEKGIDITIADGYWIIVIGVGGWVRYIGEFGLMTMPAVLLFLQRRRYGIEPEAAVLALIVAATLIDAIPNSAINPVTWLIVGALWGRLEQKKPGQTATITPEDSSARRQKPVYARDFSAQSTDQPDRDADGRYTRSLKPLYREHRQSDIS